MRLALLQWVSIYFFVPLVVGLGLLLTAPRGKNIQRTVAWVLIGAGGLGALAGVPYWIGRMLS